MTKRKMTHPGAIGQCDRRLTVVMELFEQTPSQLHDVVHWKTNEPDFDRVMRHFYPREIPKGMEPKSAPKGDRTEEDAPEWEDSREQPQKSRGPDPEVEWTEEEAWEEDWESTDREEPGAEDTAPETPAPSHLKKRSRTVRSTLRPSASMRTGSRG